VEFKYVYIIDKVVVQLLALLLPIRRTGVRFLVDRPDFIVKVVSDFPQCLEANARILPQSRPLEYVPNLS
jgi:hypothetical protein